MNPIDELLGSISKTMTELINNDSIRVRCVEPSPGDTFDVNYSRSYGERFYYINTDYVLPLHRLEDGEIVEFRAYKESGHDVVSWEAILDSIEESEYLDEVTVETVGNKNAHKDSEESSVVNWLSQLASSHPNTKVSMASRMIIEAINGRK